MKKIRLLSLLWIVLFASTLAGCWNKNNNWDIIIEDTTSQTDAVIKYNDNLVDAASSCIESENSIRNAYYDENASIEDIKSSIENTIKECTTAKDNINSLWNWEWDSSLKDWITNIIEKYITYYSKFSEMLPYLEQEEITEEQNEKYELLLSEIETLDNELNNANEDLISIQENFAKNHWFELESNEEIENSEEVSHNEFENTVNEENNEEINDEYTTNEETNDEGINNEELNQ